jgi:hypothetical protein
MRKESKGKQTAQTTAQAKLISLGTRTDNESEAGWSKLRWPMRRPTHVALAKVIYSVELGD